MSFQRSGREQRWVYPWSPFQQQGAPSRGMLGGQGVDPGYNIGAGFSPMGSSPFAQPFGGFRSQFGGGGMTSSQPLGFDTVDDPAKPAEPGIPNVAKSGGNIAGRILDWAKSNPKDALTAAGNTASAILEYQQMSRANKLREREVEMEREERERRRKNDEAMGPARAQLLQMLMGNLAGGR